jgi:hypothetical protein
MTEQFRLYEPLRRHPARQPEQPTRARKLSPGEELWIARKLHGSSGGAFNMAGQCVNADESLTAFEAAAEARGVKAFYRR